MRYWILVGIGVVLFSLDGLSQTTLPWSVIGSGGTTVSVGNNRNLSSTIGQVIIGVGVITDGSAISQGFWLPIDQSVSVDEENPMDHSTIVSNYPNPFSATTTIRFHQPVEGPVQIRIYDLVGNLVRTLNAELSTAGSQEVAFDGLGETGAPLAAGAYLYEVTMSTATGEQVRSVQRLSIVR